MFVVGKTISDTTRGERRKEGVWVVSMRMRKRRMGERRRS